MIAAALVAPGIPLGLRAIGAVAALIATVAAMIIFGRLSANDYESHTRLWLTPLNPVMIGIYLGAATAVAAVQRW